MRFDDFARGRDPSYTALIRSVLTDLNIIRADFNDGPWLAGGTLRRLYGQEPFMGADFDIFCQNSGQIDSLQKTLVDLGGKLRCVTDNAYTYTYNCGYREVTVQVIKKIFDNPQSVIDAFDLTSCQIITNGQSILVGPMVLEYIRDKRNGLNYDVAALDPRFSPVDTIHRLIKCGYMISPHTLRWLFLQVIKNPRLLENTMPRLSGKLKEQNF